MSKGGKVFLIGSNPPKICQITVVSTIDSAHDSDLAHFWGGLSLYLRLKKEKMVKILIWNFWGKT